MHRAFERPVLNLFHQLFANWIFLNINPFGRIMLTFPQTMMPAAWLKTPVYAPVPPPECPFPKSDPLLNRERQIARCAKRTEMVWHQQIITDQPRRCFQPCPVQKFVGGFVGQPRQAILGGHGQQDKIRPAQLDIDSAGGILSANLIFKIRVHIFYQGSTESRPTLFISQGIHRVHARRAPGGKKSREHARQQRDKQRDGHDHRRHLRRHDFI
jgi:hypothetical protein